MKAVLAIQIISEPQSNLEEKVKPSILKDDFSSRAGSSIFTSIAPVLLEQSNETTWVFPAVKSISHFLPQSALSCRPIQVLKLILVVTTDQMADHV